MDPSSSNLNSEQSGNITYMDPDKYMAALEGNVDAFKNYTEPLHHLVTRGKNTVLHIYFSGKTLSTEFVQQILDMCPSLLKQANIKGETPLQIAARYGHEGLKLFIERAKDRREDPESGVGAAREMLRMTNKEKETALHEAVRYNHIGVVKILIAEDPDFPYSANDWGETPLYMAAVRGYRELVVEILENCTSKAYGGPGGKTALHAAVILGDEEMTRKILDKTYSNLTKKADQKGWTPLHYASDLDHESIVKLLLEFDKSAAYIADKDGKIALHIAVSRIKPSRSMLVLLQNSPDCCELVDNRGWNVVHTAIKNNSLSTIILLQRESIRSLLNERDIDGNTPLHLLAAATSYVPYMFLPEIDIMAVNRQNLTAIDILSANNGMHCGQKNQITELLQEVGKRPSGRNIVQLERSREAEIDQELEKAKEYHLVVAALIATVTFAAGFTVPGSFKTDKGLDQGTAILIRSSAFKAFVITDAIAMVSSTSAVFIHFLMAFGEYKGHFQGFFLYSFFLTLLAMGAMVVAFVTGIYAVLAPSPGLAIVTCFIGLSFFLILLFMTVKWFKFSMESLPVEIQSWMKFKNSDYKKMEQGQ